MKYTESYGALPNLSLESSASIANQKSSYDTMKICHDVIV